MIFTWFAGDFLKTLYFIIEAQPIQFIMCGTVQLSVDIMIIVQIINYKRIDSQLYNPVPADQVAPVKYTVNEELGSWLIFGFYQSDIAEGEIKFVIN